MDHLCFKAAFVLTLCLFDITGADDSADCLFRRFDVEECVDTARFQFQNLDRISYNSRLCQGTQHMMDCIARNRRECPDMSILQGYPGDAINNMTQTYSLVCSQMFTAAPAPHQGMVGEAAAEGSQADSMCPGGRKKFRGRLDRCYEPLNVALKEDQMCNPTRKTNKCLRKQLRKFIPCGWMKALAAHQLQFGIDYNEVRRAVRFRCARS